MASTIAAISTASGQAGVGMIRISGPKAIEIADKIFRPYHRESILSLSGYSAAYGTVSDSIGDIDEAVCLVFRAPKSYTGENVVELTAHGGEYVLERVLRSAIDAGATVAQPGEFTKRAFLNGRISLTQAEAVAEMISATGAQSQRAALEAQRGRVGEICNAVRADIVAACGHISASIDYPEEDIDDMDSDKLAKMIASAKDGLVKLISDFDSGRVIKNGVDTVIVGAANVGKSTLMNLLAGCERSIVTDIAGTTRDVVETDVRFDGMLLRLSDTAGLRQSDDPVESVGIGKARERLAQAGLVLCVLDGEKPLSPDDSELVSGLKDRPAVIIVNKCDRPQRLSREDLLKVCDGFVEISAKTGDGRERLSAAVKEILKVDQLDSAAAMLVSERQRSCAVRACDELNSALVAVNQGTTPDVVVILLESAIENLSELSGETATEQVVNEVFSKFCVGK